jgi:hypothetical protein
MKIRTTFALAVATLTLGVPVATAAPDGYQPELQSNAQPDVVDRYVANALRQADQPDAVGRYLRNHSIGADSAPDSTGASSHPDSLAVRPGASDPVNMVEAGEFNWTTVVFGTLVGVLSVLLAIVGVSAMREGRRFLLRY